MKSSARPVLSCFLFTLLHTRALVSQSEYAATVLRGVSNEGRNLEQPYVTAGDRAYLIGTQDGGFPDLGQHTPGEMGGLWLHPIKLAPRHVHIGPAHGRPYRRQQMEGAVEPGGELGGNGRHDVHQPHEDRGRGHEQGRAEEGERDAGKG